MPSPTVINNDGDDALFTGVQESKIEGSELGVRSARGQDGHEQDGVSQVYTPKDFDLSAIMADILDIVERQEAA